MALLQCDFYSEVLNLATSLSVILPQVSLHTKDLLHPKPQTLYLLHGLGGRDHKIWQRQTSIERYVAKLDVAVVMPIAFAPFIRTWCVVMNIDKY